MNLKNYQTLPNAILQERVKITYGWHFLERRLDFHVEICFLLASIFFSSHYIIKISIYHPSRLPAEGPVHCFSSYKQWPLNSKLAMHHNAHRYQKPLDCQEKLWRLLLLPNSYLCNAIIQYGWSPCVDCGYIGFSAFLTAMLFCYNCFIPGLSAYFWEVVLKHILTDIWDWPIMFVRKFRPQTGLKQGDKKGQRLSAIVQSVPAIFTVQISNQNINPKGWQKHPLHAH